MKSFPAYIHFVHPWRSYQQRVLDELQQHLLDGHLHVIAPPGSGKTVLGLEVALRLNKPLLILAPTLAIRDQWVLRFCELFLRTHSTPEWISKDIRKPAFMTVVTYQGLHMACNDLRNNEEGVSEEENPDEEETEASLQKKDPYLRQIVKGLKAQGVSVIIADEAHHLKNGWWRTLTRIKEQLNPVMVGLTATPPYDVSAAEWDRYMELNGPVDAEISVPELVLEGDLCPHQDYVYFSLPATDEMQHIHLHRRRILELFEELKLDSVLLQALQQHPAWLRPDAHFEWIYANMQQFSAMLIFLHAAAVPVPEKIPELLGNKGLRIPLLDMEWMEVLLNYYLYREKEHFAGFQEHRRLLENRLKRAGALDKKQVRLQHTRNLRNILASGIRKLDAIEHIARFESEQLGRSLRMLVLTDYVRREFYVNSPGAEPLLNKMGVFPVFEQLRRAGICRSRLGLLSGSLLIIPAQASAVFEQRAALCGIKEVRFLPLYNDTDYAEVVLTERVKNEMVHIVTFLFQEGYIEILSGTKALLGEGWDAPAINTLVLASTVGSFVLSNQMRGRAIRIQKENSNKTGNIWHLVCIDPGSPGGGDDLEMLRRRFRSFVGVSYQADSCIENGTERIQLPVYIGSEKRVQEHNRITFERAAARSELRQQWHKALEKGQRLVEEIRVPFSNNRTENYNTARDLYLRKTIAGVLATLGTGLAAFAADMFFGFLRGLGNIRSFDDVLFYISIVFIIALVIFGRHTYFAFRTYLKYRDIAKDLQHIAEALLAALRTHNLIAPGTDTEPLAVHTSVDEYGAVHCYLKGGTTFDRSFFTAALQEIVNPVENPRYIIVRKSRMLFLEQRDYHAVPVCLARNEKMALYFMQQWEQRVGKCELVYTRTPAGRKMLLQARFKSLAAQFEEPLSHVHKWK